ncbi:hypothetical protein B0H21DRAFT_707450 [Amylocystis lapponica]|nr:hypothetical protein B0H21DRAFT_707450 [Amylocystis lapponica]
MSQPLHISIKNKRIDLLCILLSAKASSFLLRDVNGSTILHVAVKEHLVPWITELLVEACPKPFELAKQDHEGPRLRATIRALLTEGRPRNGTKLTTELLAFADNMEAKFAAEQAEAEAEAKPATARTRQTLRVSRRRGRSS